MKRSNFGWRTVFAFSAAVLIFGFGVVSVIPAQAAPPAKAPQDVNVTNTSLPVTGSVAVTGNVGTLLPARPFATSVDIAGGGDPLRVVGPLTGTLGLGAITITNFDNIDVQVEIQAVIVNPGTTCETSTVIGGSFPNVNVLVEAHKTMHLTYPTPLTFQPLLGNTCVGLSVNTVHTNAVSIAVNGSVQP